MHHPAPARGDDAQRALVERSERLRRRIVDLDDDIAPRRREEAQHPVAHRGAEAQAAVDHQHLDAEAGGLGREALDQRADVGRPQVDHRPHVQEDPVPDQPPARLAARLEAADALQRLHQHELELGERRDAALLVAHRGEVAHLGDREQPLVLRVRAAAAVEQVDVLGRRQALDRELAEPPQAQAVRHHRVQAAEHLVLDQPVGAGPEREGADGGHAQAAFGRRDADDDPVHARRQRDRGEDRVQPLGGHVLGVVHVEVGDGEVAGRRGGGPGREAVRGRGEAGEVHEGRGEMPPRPVVPVARTEQRACRRLELGEPLERADAVEAAGHDLEQHAPQRGPGGRHPPQQHRGQRPRAGDERADPIVPIRALGLGGERQDVRLHLGVGAVARCGDDGLVEAAEADLAREVADDLVEAGGGHDDLVERRAQGVASGGRALEQAVEQREDGGTHRARVQGGEEDAVAGRLQGRRAVQGRDAVPGEHRLEALDEGARQPLGLGVQ